MKLGVFDSGIGGLSVLKSLLDSEMFSHIVYFGDTARVPYGTKDENTIIKFSLEALEFFKAQKVDMLVLACNTASAYALESLKKSAPFPVIGVITPGVMAVKNKLQNLNSENYLDSEILVIATKATIKSNLYAQKLQNLGFKNIKSLATGLFVPFVEEGIFNGKLMDELLNHYFAPLFKPQVCEISESKKPLYSPDALILGCTHFPLIASALQNYFGTQTMLIHSGEAIVQYIKQKFGIKSDSKLQNLEFFASDDLAGLKRTAGLWLGRAVD